MAALVSPCLGGCRNGAVDILTVSPKPFFALRSLGAFVPRPAYLRRGALRVRCAPGAVFNLGCQRI
eukprot:3763400-Pyramimonas_sp.AAC.1